MRLRAALVSITAFAALMAVSPSHAAGEAPVVVGTDPIDNPLDPEAQAAWDAAGLDLRELAIHRPDFGADELVFIIRVENLEVTPPPGEVVRYLWQMTVDGVQYWINAKSTDIAATGTADDPAGTVANAATQSSFRLRSRCGVIGVVSNCFHVMWLNGVFDAAADEIRISVPLNDPRAPEFKAGAVISGAVPNVALNISASIQAGVSNASTSDQTQTDVDYTIPAA